MDLGGVELGDAAAREELTEQPGTGRGQLVEMQARTAKFGMDREEACPGRGFQ